MDEKPEIDAEDICATLLQSNKCGDIIGDESFKVKVDANLPKIQVTTQMFFVRLYHNIQIYALSEIQAKFF